MAPSAAAGLWAAIQPVVVPVLVALLAGGGVWKYMSAAMAVRRAERKSAMLGATASMEWLVNTLRIDNIDLRTQNSEYMKKLADKEEELVALRPLTLKCSDLERQVAALLRAMNGEKRGAP